jgi:SprT protein
MNSDPLGKLNQKMQSQSQRQISAKAMPPGSVEAPCQSPLTADIRALVQEARDQLKALGCPQLADRLEIRWNARMRSTAGTAYAGRALITLNPRLLEFGMAEVTRTLRHELAHLLAHHRAGRHRIAAHGAEWQKACVELGLPGEKRCHDLPLPRRKLERRHVYRCPHCKLEVPRVKPLRRKSACLACCRAHAGGRYDERFRLVKLQAK